MTVVLSSVGWNQCVALLLGIAVWLACRTRTLAERPALCHALWLLVLLKLVTPAIIPVPLLPAIAAPQPVGDAAPASPNVAGFTTTTIRSEGAPQLEGDSGTSSTGVEIEAAHTAAKSLDLPPSLDSPRSAPSAPWQSILVALAAVSLSVTLVLWLAAIRQQRRVGRLLRAGSVHSGREVELLQSVSTRFKLRSAANLVMVDAPVAPMLWAVPGCSSIVLPRRLAESLTDDPLRFIMAHEVGHFVRRDHWTNLFAFVGTSLFWWNPIAWLARRELATAAEACCDSLALERLAGSRRSYAETLLAAVDFVAATRPLPTPLAVTFGASRSLRARIALVANTNVTSRISRGGWALLVVAALFSIAFPIHGVEKTAKPGAANPDTENAGDAQPAPGAQLPLPTDVQPGEIAGVVVDSAGQPLAGVLVDAWTWYPGTETTTDENGLFRLKTGDDTSNAEVRWSKPGYSPYYVLQQPVGVASFVVRLGNKTLIKGVVRDPAGRPVAGALLKGIQGPKRADGGVVGEIETSTTTDAAGHYRLFVFPDTYEIRVAVAGVGATRIPGIAVGADQARSLDVDLKPGVRFEAQVVEAGSGKPVESVVLWSWRDRSVLGISDAAGKIVIGDMLPGKFQFDVGQGPLEQRDGMSLYGNGFLGRWWSADAVNKWEHRDIDPGDFQRNLDHLTFDLTLGMKPVTIEVERGVTFSGHVYDPDGKPVAGATVGPAQTGTGNSLTGDTRYSVKTEKDGSYRVVMPAGNDFAYNLVAHDGDYQEWRSWANAVTEPLTTKPNQQVENLDLTLNRPATVRGRVVTDGDRVVGGREVRAAAADLRDNRYYDPTVKAADDGTFELKFIRPGKNRIQVAPFWLSAADAPPGTSVEVDLKAGDVREGIELRVPPSADPVSPALASRTFHVKLLDASGKPAPKQPVAIFNEFSDAGGSTTAMTLLEPLVGDRPGLAERAKRTAAIDRKFSTGADGAVAIPGAQLFGTRASTEEGDTVVASLSIDGDETSSVRAPTATVVAIDAAHSLGAVGTPIRDAKNPEITLRLAPLCEVSVPISTKNLPDADQPIDVLLQSHGTTLLVVEVEESFEIQLPPGEYSMSFSHASAEPRTVKFTVKPDLPKLTLDPVEFKLTKLAMLIGKPAPELRGIAEWRGKPVRLSDLRGKVVILDFWAHWCGPCVASMPNLMKLHDAYPEQEVVIVAIHDTSVPTIAELLTSVERAKKDLWGGRDLPFRIALSAGATKGVTKDATDSDAAPVSATFATGTYTFAADAADNDAAASGQMVADYGIQAFPTTLLIDRQGNIAGQLNLHDLEAAKQRIDGLLGK